ncbi:hypothetical protein SLE2022_223900 [Rubroshorea leprosula]
MSLLSRFFYKRPPDGLLEFVERVYVFDSCFSAEVLPEEMYQIYLHEIVNELYEEFPESSFLAFNFREGEKPSQFAEILSEYDVTVLDYPRQYEGCPLLPLSLIQHFLRVCESWLSLGNHQNVILLHCERGGWPLLAFLLSSFLIFRKLHTGERKTLEIVHREAPKGFLQLLSPLNPFPSQLRYLQYVARRNIAPEWPPPERALSLDCVIIRAIPSFDAQNGCRPIIRIFGRNLHGKGGLSTQMLFSMSKKRKNIRHYCQADCDVIKIDIQCFVQGDVVLECVHLDLDPEREVMMFRVMFNTAFIRSNILMLNPENLDMLWDSKERYPKGFRAEVLFGEVDSASPTQAPTTILNGEEKGGLPIEAFSRVQELFSGIDWVENGDDAALWFLKQLSVLSDVKEFSRFQTKGYMYASPADSEDASSTADSLDEALDGMHKLSVDPMRSLLPDLVNASPPSFESFNDSNFASETPEQASVETIEIVQSEETLSDSSLPIQPLPPTLSSTPPPSPPPPPPPLPPFMIGTSVPRPPPPPSCPPLSVSVSRPTPPPPPPPPPLFGLANRDSITPPLATTNKVPPPPPPPPNGFSSKNTPSPTSSKGPPPPPPPPPFSTSRNPPPTPPPPPPTHTQPSLSPPPPPPPPPAVATSTIGASHRAPSPPLPPSRTPLPPPPPPPPPPGHNTSNAPLPSLLLSPPPPPPPPPGHNNGNAPLPLPSPTLPPPPPLPPGRSTGNAPLPPPPPPPPLGNNGSVPKPPAPPPPPPPGPTRSGVIPPSAPQAPAAPPPPPASGRTAAPPPPPGVKVSTVPPPPPPSVGKGKTLGPASHGRGRGVSGVNSGPKKTSLKPLHWVKVSRAVQGSLWADSQKQDNQSRAPEIDMSELESLFSAASTSDGSGTNRVGGRRGSNINKPEKVQLVDLRRAYNCEIMLSKIKVPLPDMINAVLALDSSCLDIDQVENLIKFCPTKEEMEMLKNYTGNKEMLGKCEQFFLELMKVPRVESKLRVFAFRITFSSQVDDLRSNLNTINNATKEVKESVKLRQIMQTILTLGNALNQGTARGSAVGFKLDSLLKLSDTRARNNKMTLMHYLCKLLAEKMPELLDFDKDLIHLEAASKIQLKTLAEEMQAVSKGLEKVEQELSASENDGAVSLGFQKVLKNFLDTAEAEVRSLISLYSEVGRNADSLSQYFGEDPARCPFEQVTQILAVFVKMFKKAREENERQADAEKKKLEKEAMKDKAVVNSSAKKDGADFDEPTLLSHIQRQVRQAN